MKKKLKIFLSIVLIIVVAAASYLLYIFKFKEYDVADEEVEQIVSNPYEIELPDGGKLILDENGELVADREPTDNDGSTNTSIDGDSSESESESSSGNDTTGKKPSSNPESTSSPGANKPTVTPKKPTVASIKQKYAPTFEALQSQADGKLNALVGRAKKEYSDKKANGESVDFGYFYNKYTGAASGLEAQTDTTFNGVLKAVEQELVANGFDKAYAQSFVDEYNAKKKERRDSLIKKALENS